MKKHTYIGLLYILLFICGFFAPAINDGNKAIKELRNHTSRTAADAGSEARQKVDIQIISDENEYKNEEDPDLQMLGKDSNVVKLLLVDNNLESNVDDAVNIDEFLEKYGEAIDKDPVLSKQITKLDQPMESLIYQIIKNSSPHVSPAMAKKYARWFVYYSKQYKIHPLLAVAVGWRESKFRTGAVSVAGAAGIMQLMPSTARAVGISNRHDPEQSIRGGVKYLNDQLHHFKDLRLALAAYNAGPVAIKRHGQRWPLPEPRYRQTNRYVPYIESFLKKQLVNMGVDPKVLSDIHFWLST